MGADHAMLYYVVSYTILVFRNYRQNAWRLKSVSSKKYSKHSISGILFFLLDFVQHFILNLFLFKNAMLYWI